MCGQKVGLYWALRSPGLLRQCASLLEPHLNQQQTCIRLSAGASAGEALPLGAQAGTEDVGTWLAGFSEHAKSQGAKSALLFCCGPAGLSSTAAAAVGRQSGGLLWHIHVEQFLFLPDHLGCGTSKRRTGQNAGLVQVVGASST
mmetsp:Transcript_3212/g.10717  ORF Transcript_3212/g.10717 Transcript_3212/m.10717 type:complete len:144 (-) Transcript_3212:105-536(-)